MIHQTLLALMDEFDRIFDGNDVILSGLVRVVHDRSQRGGLTASSRAGHKHQPFVQTGKFLNDRRQAELVGCQHLRRDLAEYGSHSVLLVEKVGSVSCLAWDFIAKI